MEQYGILVIGSGEAGKYRGWTMAKAGRRTAVVERKQKIVDNLIEMHLQRYKASGAELIVGEARFIGALTVETQRGF